MGPLSASFPKPLLPIANRPVITHQIEVLQSAGISRVTGVVGPGGEQLRDAINREVGAGAEISFVEQKQALGSAHALAQASRSITDWVLVMLGDYFVYDLDLPAMLAEGEGSGSCVMAVKEEPDVRALTGACSVMVANGWVTGIVEKPRAPFGRMKGCGVYLIGPEFLDVVARTPRTALKDEYELTHSFDIYLREGNAVRAHKIQGWDVNLTTPRDLLECNLRWLKSRGLEQLIGQHAAVCAGSNLKQVVLGDRCRIDEPTRLERVVVFPGTVVSGGGSYREALITSDFVVDLEPGGSVA
jgi:NDP-sugar pyrophosphorylase family protein